MRMIAWAIWLILATASAAAQDAGNPVAGQGLARQWCAECHDIGAAGAQAPTRGPPFEDIARMPSTTGLALSVFLRSPHATMPNITLTKAQSDDLVAYILSLAKR